MSLAEQNDLVLGWQERGDAAARERLLRECMPHVMVLASRFCRHGLERDDLVAQGHLGALVAIDRFDVSRGVRLSTYASFWIRAFMVEAMTSSWRRGKTGMGASRGRKFFVVRRERARLECLRSSPAEVMDGLAGLLGVTTRKVAEYLEVIDNPDFSLQSYAEAGGNPDSLPVLASGEDGPDRVVEEHERHALFTHVVSRALETLSERERHIVMRRHMDDDAASFSTLGREMGISRERVRQLEARCMQKLESALHGLGMDTEAYRQTIA
jgi:RNA polymerase sigma-32 factor